MRDDLVQKAVAAALAGGWEEAIKLNKQILKKEKKDVEALNRLARAYAEQGSTTKAKRIAKRVIKIDPFNKIALKSLEKWKKLEKGKTIVSGPSSAEAFLEEPGKTKIVSLLHLGASGILAKLDSGDEVKLNPHKHRVSITTLDGRYIGRLSDDVAARLRKLIRLGNEYQALIKSVTLQAPLTAKQQALLNPKGQALLTKPTDSQDVKIFIRETKRAEGLKDVPSFPTEKINYISFTPPELVHKKENIMKEEEEG